GARIPRRDLHRRDTLKTVDEILRDIAIERLRTHPILLLLSGFEAHATELPLARAIDRIGARRVRHDRTRLATRAGTPLFGLAGVERQRRRDHRRVVLLRSI